jgi:hypothetical protein
MELFLAAVTWLGPRPGGWLSFQPNRQDPPNAAPQKLVASELHDLASDPAMQSAMERLRGALGRLTAGPLTPERFNP